VHELSLVASIFEIIEAEAAKHGAARVISVTLKVGVLSGAVPDLLVSAFEAYRQGTRAEGSRLDVVAVPIRLRCPDCGGSTVREDADFSCAACGSRRVEIVEGRELLVERIELETDDA